MGPTPARAPISLGNEADPAFSLMGFANAAEISEDGTTLIPYGNWPHSEGIQRFGLEQAQAIVARFKSTWGTFKRAIVGLPVFRGHPDIPSLANEYPDKTEYGQIADLEAKPEGLAFRLILSSAGAGLVAKGLKYISPHWLANAVGKQGDRTIYEPALLKSVGLTSRPNIPNKSLVNTAASMNPKLLTLLASILNLKPLANATVVTEAQVNDAAAALPEGFTLVTGEALANERTEKAGILTRATTAEKRVKELEDADNARQLSLANERKSSIANLVNEAVKAGKIRETDKAVWTRRLELDFENESKALGNSQALKTTPTAEQRRLADMDRKLKAGRGGEGTAPLANDGDSIGDLVNAELTAMGCTDSRSRGANYNQAFANVKRRKPDLFAPVEALQADGNGGAR